MTLPNDIKDREFKKFEEDVGGNVAVRVVQTEEATTPLTPLGPGYATVDTSSSLILVANSNRKGLVIVNTSSNNVSLGLGVAAVLYSGITLSPYGSWSMDEYDFTTDAIYAIASAVTSNVSIQEYE